MFLFLSIYILIYYLIEAILMSILLFVIWLKNVDVQCLQFYYFYNHSPFPYSQDIYITLQHFISTTHFNTKCRNTCLVYVLNNYDTITYNFPPLMKIITLHTHTQTHLCKFNIICQMVSVSWKILHYFISISLYVFIIVHCPVV